jgi:hypothetical protein
MKQLKSYAFMFYWFSHADRLVERMEIVKYLCQVQKISESEKLKILKYLKSGSTLWEEGMHSFIDIFKHPFETIEDFGEAAGRWRVGAFVVRGNSEWVWSSAFTYYFEKYNFYIHPDFLESIRKDNYKCEILSDGKIEEMLESAPDSWMNEYDRHDDELEIYNKLAKLKHMNF